MRNRDGVKFFNGRDAAFRLIANRETAFAQEPDEAWELFEEFLEECEDWLEAEAQDEYPEEIASASQNLVAQVESFTRSAWYPRHTDAHVYGWRMFARNKGRRRGRRYIDGHR